MMRAAGIPLPGAGEPPDPAGGRAMRAARYSRRQMRSGPLVLVNRQHPLAEEPRQLLTAADERYPNILLERQAARLLGRLHPGSRRGAGDRAGLRLAQSGGAAGHLGGHPAKTGRGVHPAVCGGPRVQRAPDGACHRPGPGSAGDRLHPPDFPRKAPAGGSGDWRPGMASPSGTTGKRSP